MRCLTILGSTGSIGQNTLNIAARFPERFQIRALAAKQSVELLAAQIRKFTPRLAVVYDADHAQRLAGLVADINGLDIVYGVEGYCEAAMLDEVDLVVAAMVGAAGLKPTLAAIDQGKNVALANKETLVMAGELVMARAAETGSRILPIDSEHSAIFQCLEGQRRGALQRIILTASGGPFRTWERARFAEITVAQALDHPNWSMGPKITIDSATLMNKGLEVIEACHLFQMPAASIEVLIHPQSIIHSMVAYHDGSVLAQLGVPDMKTAIAYALSYPERLQLGQPLPDWSDLGQFTFETPDLDKFPCLALAFAAMGRGGTAPAVLNAANEAAVAAFLNHQLAFNQIPQIIEGALELYSHQDSPELADILQADQAARTIAEARIAVISGSAR
ncbi:MAG: 1-deoxy-D-xylulose-5-phosphate reductoisomerase [Desulfobacterales bacterium]